MVEPDKPTVLFVEDEALVRAIISEELQEAGFEVIEMSDGRQAIDFLEKSPCVQLLFTDIRMPGGISGWEVAEQARDLCPDIPVIYATGFTDDDPRIVKGSRFFKKPYRAAAIIAAARDLGVFSAA